MLNPATTCTFCGEPYARVRRMLVGPNGNICEGCVAWARGEIAGQDKIDGLIGATELDLQRSTKRLECLQLAIVGLQPHADAADVVARAGVFADFVLDGARAPALVLDHDAFVSTGRAQDHA